MAKTDTLFDFIGVYLLLYITLWENLHNADTMKISTKHRETGKEGKVIFTKIVLFSVHVAAADPGFLKGGFRCVDDGVCFADFISFFLKIP